MVNNWSKCKQYVALDVNKLKILENKRAKETVETCQKDSGNLLKDINRQWNLTRRHLETVETYQKTFEDIRNSPEDILRPWKLTRRQ